MSEYSFLARESQILIYAGILGLEIGLVYDAFRIIRRVWKCGFAIVSCMDILFGAFVTFRTFYMVHTWSNGTLRWFAVCGIVTAFVLYIKVFSKIIVKTGIFVLSYIKGIMDLLKKCLTKLLKLPIIKLGSYVRRGRLDGRKSSISDEIS